MNQKIRKAQLEVLTLFSKSPKHFALAGGTALELFYLKHRFSKDLDFFSPEYNIENIEFIISKFKKSTGVNIKLESELLMNSQAKMRVYIMPVKGSKDPLKIDFVEDISIKKPKIKKFQGIPVYSVEELYFRKIITLTGTNIIEDSIGRELAAGRGEVRDIIDVYYLSRKVKPLHLFLKNISREYQRGMIQWYRTYSRQDFKIDYLDYTVYDKGLNSREIILHLDNEVNAFISEELR